MNWKLVVLKIHSLRSQFATSIPTLFNTHRYGYQSHIATSSNLKSQIVTASSRLQMTTLKKLRIVHSL